MNQNYGAASLNFYCIFSHIYAGLTTPHYFADKIEYKSVFKYF